MEPPTIDPRALHARRSAGDGCYCIDVRTPAEYGSIHATGTDPFPLDALDADEIRRRSGGRTVFVFCQGGGRATQAARRLMDAGLPDCVVVDGGTQAWTSFGLPVERGRAAMSLERQVRIAAGSLVLVGVALALTVQPWCIGLSAFVGAGLVFAGITDWCGMGLVLARMPWNRGAGDACSTPASRPAPQEPKP